MCFFKFTVRRFLLSLKLKKLRTRIIFVFLCFVVLLLFYLGQHRLGENHHKLRRLLSNFGQNIVNNLQS